MPVQADPHLPAMQEIAPPSAIAAGKDPEIVAIAIIVHGKRDLAAGLATGHSEQHRLAHDAVQRGLESQHNKVTGLHRNTPYIWFGARISGKRGLMACLAS